MTDVPEGEETRPRRSPDAYSLELDGELVVIHATNGAMHKLDPIASVIFPLLDGSATVPELVDELTEAFGAPREVVDRDVRNLLEQLDGLGLLASDDDANPGGETASGEDPTAPGEAVRGISVGDSPAPQT